MAARSASSAFAELRVRGAPVLTASGLAVAREEAGPNVLDHAGLTLHAGECVLVQGPTGAGKSTLLRALAGASGVVLRSGRIDRDGDSALLLQHIETQLLCPTVGEEIGVGLRGRALSAGEKRSRIARALRDVGLEGFEDRETDALSAGERQRVVLAALEVLEPTTLLLDEPLASLDATSRRRLSNVIARLKASGTALLVAEHALRELLDVVDRAFVLESGKLFQVATPAAPSVRAPRSGARAAVTQVAAPDTLDALARRARVLLTGPNGAGKSLHLGRLARAGSRRGAVALVIQEPRRGLFARTVREELAFGIDRITPGVADRDARIEDLLDRFALRAFADRSPRRLSFGQQHALAIAAALAARPAFVLLDEPFAGLDAGARDALLHALEIEQAENETALLIASHDRDPLDAWCHEVAELERHAGASTAAKDSRGGAPQRPLQYRSGDSPFHRAPPGAKFACAFTVAIAALLVDSPLVLGCMLAATALGYLLARLPVAALWRDVRWLLVQAAIVVALSVALRGEAGWTSGSRAALQIALVFLPMALFVRTTRMERVVDGLVRWLPERVGFAIGATLRFLPFFAREFGELVEMQRLRGARLSLREVARPRAWRDALACVAVPMTLRAIEVAHEAADAAEIRGLENEPARLAEED